MRNRPGYLRYLYTEAPYGNVRGDMSMEYIFLT
jgi:hypothetical protein